MSYSDVLNAVDIYGNTLNKSIADYGTESNKLGNINDPTIYGRTQPLRGPNTFMGSSSRNIYGNEAPEVYDPRDMYQDEEGNWVGADLTTRGMGAAQTALMAQQASPYVSDALTQGASMLGKQYVKNIATGEIGTAAKGLTTEQLTAQGLEATAGPSLSGVGYGLAIKGFTNDRNPYTYTGTEKIGDYAGNVLMARSIAPALGVPLGSTKFATATGMNPYVLAATLLFSWWMGKKKKKKAQQLIKKAEKEVSDAQYEGYEDRAEQVAEARDKYLADASQQQWEQESGRYDNQYGGAYNTPANYRYAEEGMKFSPKELKKISKAGRNGDTMLAHINPQEAQMLKAMGGSGTINPYTGLREYGFGSFIKGLLGGATDIVRDVTDPVTDVIGTGFDALGNVIEPGLSAIGSGINTIGENVLTPVVEGIAEGSTDLVKGGADVATKIWRPVGELASDILEKPMDFASDFVGGIPGALEDFLGGGEDFTMPTFEQALSPEGKRAALEKANTKAPLKHFKSKGISSKKDAKKKTPDNLYGEKFRGELDNPLIRENVLELAQGGKVNTVAEFTGNELIVNDQATVEKGLAKGNYSIAAAPIRKAMKKGYVTPGMETHQGNPMPVDDKGNIYASGGTLPFQVNKGAGVYDHATDQFKPTMTDKEIAMIAQSNINKWELNGMA